MEIRQTFTLIGKPSLKISNRRIFKNKPFLRFKDPTNGSVTEMDREATAKFLKQLDEFGDNCSEKCKEFREAIRTALKG